MKKKLNTTAITNDLSGASLFFPNRATSQSAAPSPAQQPMPSTGAGAQSVRTNARTDERPNGKRIITRNSFEVYEDQMDALRELSYQEKRLGKLGSMSAMVREAIDTYLKTRPRRQG